MTQRAPAVRIAARLGAVIAVLGIIILVARSSLWFAVFSSASLHNQRIQQATERMQSYREEDWRSLYASCMELYQKSKPSDTAIAPDQWPKPLSELQPYNVWVHDDCIAMNWTGGFDDFTIWMYIYRHDSQMDGSPCAAGVHIVDTRDILPANPYDKGTDTSSHKPNANTP